MHTIYTYSSVKQLEKYFTGNNPPEAYYSETQEFPGFWVGEAASRLGLHGRVDDASFKRLCNNQHPETGKQLTARMRSDRRLAQDHVFSVPKSVSLAYAYTGDERIIQAGRQAGFATYGDMEQLACARVRKNGEQYKDRPTRNLAGAEYVHLTARPVGGVPDPHFHMHYVIFNVTHDHVENQWKAVQMGDIVEEADNFDKIFLARLAENLKKIGLEITPGEKSFELSGFPHELNDRFSRRTKTIEDTAERLGIKDPAQKAKLGAMTREEKAKTVLMPELREIWFSGLSEEELKPLERVKTLLQRSRAVELSQEVNFKADGERDTASGRLEPRKEAKRTPDSAKKAVDASELLGTRKKIEGSPEKRRESLNRRTRPTPVSEEVVEPTEHDRRAVAFAIQHLFERQSMVTETQLVGAAFKDWNLGEATVAGVKQVLAETPLLRAERGDKLYVTTPEVLAEEQRLVNRCLDGKNKCEELNPFWRIEDESLNEQQRKAVNHVLTSRDWVVGISGKAGTGKTKLLNEVRRGVESGMYKLIALAPGAEAAHDNLRKEGFKNAETVAKFLVSEAMQKEARGAVLLVDEAGLLSTRQADRLFKLAQELDARLVLVGDTGQHHAVERGQAFDLLEKSGEMATVRVTEIMRQHGGYKQVVELVAAGKLEEAFELPEFPQHVKEMSLEGRKIALANDYVAAIEQGRDALVIAPTHVECDDVTEGIRTAMKEKKMLGESVQWDTLRNLSWTEAERSDYVHYKNQVGLVAQFNGHVKGFALGEQVEVIGVSDGVVRVRSRADFHPRIKSLPLEEADKFNIYERDTLEVCQGEKIRVTINTRTADNHRLNNGNLHTVDYIDHQGRLVLENGWRLDKDFEHFKYGYTMTSHSAQGKTVDVVFVAQSAALSMGASDLNQFYVSLSRGRDDFKIYTDDIELLKEYVSRVRERPMATELLAEESKPEMKVEATEKLSAGLGKTDGHSINEQLEKQLIDVDKVLVPPPTLEPEQAPTMSMSM